MNVSDNVKIKKKKNSNSKELKFDLLKRITQGQSGVVLEVLF